MRDKDTVTVAGIVSQKREIPTKKKDTMAYVTIEDLKGSYTGIVFCRYIQKLQGVNRF